VTNQQQKQNCFVTVINADSFGSVSAVFTVNQEVNRYWIIVGHDISD